MDSNTEKDRINVALVRSEWMLRESSQRRWNTPAQRQQMADLAASIERILDGATVGAGLQGKLTASKLANR